MICPRYAGVTIFTLGLVALTAAPAVADNGFYASAHVGLTLPQDQFSEGLTTGGLPFVLDSDFDNGFRIGGSFGYKFEVPGINIRTELELSYREQDVDTVVVNGISVPGGGDTSSLSGLANVLIDFKTFPLVTPYVGGGLGIAGVESDSEFLLPVAFDGFTDVRFDGGTETEFVYQVIAGVTLPLTDRFDLFIDGRYFEAIDPDFDLEDDATGVVFGPSESEFEIITVNIGFRFHF